MSRSESWVCNAQEIPYSDLVSQLSRTLAAANHFLVKLLAEQGIDGLVPSHGDILLQLFSCKSLPMSGLAQTIGKDPSTVTALVKKLIASDYVETIKNPLDKRITEVRLTEKGRALGADIEQVNMRLIETMKKGMSEAELTATARSLTKIRENFEKASEG